ncbi:MAG TPA: hypothetical protein VJ828_06915 [Lacipirellulaceae bacterium]|nr:hypothetical protein [Lacipirellulaceae bacterium]
MDWRFAYLDQGGVLRLTSKEFDVCPASAIPGKLTCGAASRMREILVTLAVNVLVISTSPASAEQLVLNLIPQSSSLTGEGYVGAVDANTAAQDPNGDSLTTTYSGTITVDVDNLSNPSSITFVSANAVAANSGNWLPEPGGGSEGDPDIDGDANPGTAAPANYGFFLDVGAIGQLYAASRDTILSLNANPISVSSGQFDPFGIAITVPHGVYEANVNSPVFGDDASVDEITDEEGTNCTDLLGTENRCGSLMGSYSVSGGMATLTLPLNFILGEGDDIEVTFTGTFVASASLSQPLVGDYNGDGTVDAADYVVWRKTNINGPQGYVDWRANFGRPPGSGAGLGGGAAVPEPASIVFLVVGVLGSWLGACRRGR